MIFRRTPTKIIVLSACTALSLSACSFLTVLPGVSPTVEKLQPVVEKRYPASEFWFTQGIEVVDNQLLISTGQYNESRIFYTQLGGLEEKHRHWLEPQYFGEGATKIGDVVWQLTWKSGVAFKRDAATLTEIEKVSYPGQGWGLCSFANELIMSDGTNELRVLDPDTFVEKRRIIVTDQSATATTVDKLNELECVEKDGRRQVYANIFLTTDIIRIDANSGEVTAVIDASSLENNAAADANNVLNGIAYLPEEDRFLITGKRWPDMYKVRFE
ncbi:glutamine cyclotransferase [Corynebacterium kutscheri]|uniref:Glutamine cyclotransferase n=1 Tax=Corynebacterium kutscheri TaxID=35755 RepID=A0AB38VP40_9CORY|nr:glutaminyl-peptide cyclotransferase [Corynebacterium kutscheri]VEH04426.1 glutamine cyclotransferase [Corynebacterium kutscheri]VEH80298.1 glutamine cyclotransferase [Corynebacterium kutscheri]